MNDVANDSESAENGEAPKIKVKDRRRFTAAGDPIEPSAAPDTPSEDPTGDEDGAHAAAPPRMTRSSPTSSAETDSASEAPEAETPGRCLRQASRC